MNSAHAAELFNPFVVQVASLVDEGQLVEIEAVAVRTHKPR